MTYLGGYLDAKLVRHLSKAVAAIGILFAVGLSGVGIASALQLGNFRSMKGEIEDKSKQIVAAQDAAKQARTMPEAQKVPRGMAGVGAFQSRLTKLAGESQCVISRFQASDMINPFVSTYASGGQADSPWGQVEVKLDLQGSTGAVMQTLRDMDGLGIPYEFTSLDVSRIKATDQGLATVSASVSLRIITIAEGEPR